MKLFGTTAGYARCWAAAFAVLLVLGPAPAAAQRPSEGESATSLFDADPNALEPNFSPASHLDPAIAQPQQSIEQLGQSETEVFVAPPRGVLKQALFNTTWINGDDLGFTDFEFTSKFGWFDVKEHSLLAVTPGFGAHLVDGPDSPDLPAQLYDLSLDVRALIPFSQTAAVEVGVTPGLFSDFEQGTDEAFRLGGRVVGYYIHSPEFIFALGAAYLDRFDVEVIPVGGVVWTPNVDTRLEATFPRGKFARRFRTCGTSEDWWFIVNEFAGGSWAIERTTGAVDLAAYRDLRLSVGWERRTAAGPRGSLEIGWVFNRHLEYESGIEIEPGDAFMIKGTIAY